MNFICVFGKQMASSKLIITSLQRQANLIILVQAMAVAALSIIFLFIVDYRTALAGLCGGLVYILPGYFYAGRLLGNVSPRATMRVMLVFYLGEALKLLSSVGLFIVLFYAFTFPLLPYFLGYLIAALAFCIAPVLLMNRMNSFS